MARGVLSIAQWAIGASSLLGLSSAALVQQYCSSQNVGDTANTQNIYNSNGECQRVCANYAFAVVQYTSCWCSNYIPYEQLSISQCNQGCPGFPDERCGDQDSGTFGYVAIVGKSPLGTKGGPSSSQAVQPSPVPVVVTVTDAQTVVQTVVQSAPPVVEPPPVQADPEPAQSTPATTSPTPTPAPSSAPTPVTLIVTAGGQIVTQIITTQVRPAPTSSSTDGSGDEGEGGSSGGPSGGTIAGAVIGGIGGIAVIAGGLWLLLSRRRRRDEEEDDNFQSSQHGAAPRRNVSTMSKTGLLRSGSEKFPTIAVPAPAHRRGSNGDSYHSDVLASPSSARRNSQPLFYDQRLNPSALMNLDNGSRNSIATIEDGRDYTRTLNVRNPDPPTRD